MSVDPEIVTFMPTYRVGFLPPAFGSLSPGEIYVEVAPPGGGAPQLWIGAPAAAGFPGNAVSMVPPGLTLEPPPPVVPVSVDVPHIAQDGAALACTMGNWEGEPTAYAYQWQLDGQNAGTDADTYTVVAQDAGKTATCIVSATNAAGTTIAPPSNAVVIEAPVMRSAPEPDPKPETDSEPDHREPSSPIPRRPLHRT
jgi:hypothetical protein